MKKLYELGFPGGKMFLAIPSLAFIILTVIEMLGIGNKVLTVPWAVIIDLFVVYIIGRIIYKKAVSDFIPQIIFLLIMGASATFMAIYLTQANLLL